MAQWHKDGRPLSDDDLAGLCLLDCDGTIEFGNAAFRFTAETVERRHGFERRSYERRAGTVVLTLRQVSAQGPPVALVDYVDIGPFDTVRCRGACHVLENAGQTAAIAARRHAAVALFRRAEELVGDRVA
jgi:hypothetical protein